jgi:hypothetical protein
MADLITSSNTFVSLNLPDGSTKQLTLLELNGVLEQVKRQEQQAEIDKKNKQFDAIAQKINLWVLYSLFMLSLVASYIDANYHPNAQDPNRFSVVAALSVALGFICFIATVIKFDIRLS